jgi:hypothetical protein
MLNVRVLAGVLAVTSVLPLFAAQDPPAPQVLGAAKPMPPAEVAARMTGTWKLNEELSPLPRAGSSPTAGAPDRGGRGGAGGGGGRGGGRGIPGVITQQQQEQLRIRAIFRELNVRPLQLTITATLQSATFVDEDGSERTVAINNKKDKLDLGTSILDAKTWWNGSALTIELDAGNGLTLTETFELSPTARQMLVSLNTGEGKNLRPGQLQGHVQRVYDRVG